MSSSASETFADTPVLLFSSRDSVPHSQPSRLAVSITFRPTSPTLSRMSLPRCGGLCIGLTRSLAKSYTVSAPFRSVVVDQLHVHGFAVLEAEHHWPVARDANAPLARAVAFNGMQPDARRIGAARMRCLLQTEQDTPKPWHETGGQPCRVVAFVQRRRQCGPGESRSRCARPHAMICYLLLPIVPPNSRAAGVAAQAPLGAKRRLA